MRKVMILLVAPIFVSTHTMESLEICYEETIIQLEPKDIQMALSERDLVSALILVESRGNDSVKT